MIEADFDLVGRYFVRLDSDNIGMEGWIRKNLGSGFYVVEVFFKTAQGF